MSVDHPLHGLGLRQGDVVAGKYRISRVIGSGGMGVVVEGSHIELDERVAIKFLSMASLSNPEVVARFIQEARASVKIKSEHVARVFDVGSLPNGAPYMAMEFLDGMDLSTWIAQRGALKVEFAVDLVLQAAEALAEAHSQGIVHRDLKPTNLFCIRRADGTFAIKVLDFGISKSLGWRPSTPNLDLTKTSAVMGSPLYISPEQMQSSKHVDVRTDIWSLGVILYEILTGEVPFDGNTIAEVCSRVTTHPTPRLRRLRPDAPARLEQVVDTCLAKDRSHRYRTIAAFAEALAPCGSSRALESSRRTSRILAEAGFGETVACERSPQGSDAVAARDNFATSPHLEGRRRFGIALTIGLLVSSMAILTYGFLNRKANTSPSRKMSAEVPAQVVQSFDASPVGSAHLPKANGHEPDIVMLQPGTSSPSGK